MKKRGIIILCTVAAVITFGMLIIILSGGNTQTFAAAFLNNPYKDGYKYSGDGTIKFGVDTEYVKNIPGFPEGNEGREFIDILEQGVKAMNMKIYTEGRHNGNIETSTLKMMSESMLQYETNYYSDGIKKWIMTSDGIEKGKWTELTRPDHIEGVISHISFENLGKVNGNMVLKEQGEDSSTFELRVTSEVAEILFGAEDKKILESIDSNRDFNKFMESLGMVVKIKTTSSVEVYTPYINISTMNVFFRLPYNRLNVLVNNSKIRELEPVEKKILDSIYMNVEFDMNFSYGKMDINRPSTL